QRKSTRRTANMQTPAKEAATLSAVAKKALDAALAALEADALDQAEKEGRAAVAAAPRSPVTHNVLGVVLDRLGRRQDAYAEFNTAIKFDPAFVSAHNNLGRMLAQEGKTAEAISE